MDFHNSLKKGLAVLLAALAVGSSVPSSVWMRAQAAEIDALSFYDRSTGEDREKTTTIVEGSSIGIRARKIPNNIFDNPPFAVEDKNSNDASHLMDIQPDMAPNEYTLLAKDKSSGAQNSTEIKESTYSLKAVNITQKTSGDGDARKAASGGASGVNISLVATSESTVAVINDSSLTFQSTAAQTPEDPDGNSSIDVGAITATGVFQTQYNGFDPQVIGIRTENGVRIFDLNIPSHDPNNPQDLRLRVEMYGVIANQPIPAGTTFTIKFKRDVYRPLTLRVISTQKLVEDAAKSIRENPTDPTASGTGRPYVQLAAGEKLDGITKSFDAYSRMHYHNVDINIDWKWVPDNPIHQSKIEIKPKPSTTNLTLFDINPPQEDMTGKIVATVTYKNNTSTVAEIPIRIYGTGELPKIKPVEKWTGNPTRDSGTGPKKESITELPKIMDVYQGDANPNYYKSEPRGPFKFTFTVDYGRARGRADYLIIRKLSGPDAAVEAYVDGGAVAYKWGDKLQDPGKSLGFEVLAAEAGQIQLQFEFYNALGEPMKTTWVTHQINVYDSRPNTDSKLKSMDLLGYSSDGGINEKLGNIYPNHVMTNSVDPALNFEFDPTVNNYATVSVPYAVDKIKVRPTIPADTNAQTEIVVEALGSAAKTISSGSLSEEIPLVVQVPQTIYVTSRAQDGSTNTYTLRVTRRRQDGNFYLKSLEAYRLNDATQNLIEGFERGKFDYSVAVDYKTEKLRVSAEPESEWATVDIEPKPKRDGILFWKSEEYVPLNGKYNAETGLVENAVTVITATVTAQDGSKKQYTVRVTRRPPDDTRTLDDIRVLDANGKQINFVDADGKAVTFNPKQLDYVVEIPYLQKKISVEALSKTGSTQSYALTQPKVYGGKTDTRKYMGDATHVVWSGLDVSQTEKQDPARDEFSYTLTVKSESGRETNPPYTIRVVRKKPNDTRTLDELRVIGEDGKPIGFVDDRGQTVTFNPKQLEYRVEIPYSAKKISVEALSKTETTRSYSLTQPKVFGGKTDTRKFIDATAAVAWNNLDASRGDKNDPARDDFSYTLTITAESGFETDPPYIIRVVRKPPDDTRTLDDLRVIDQNGDPVNFVDANGQAVTFNTKQLDYVVRIPYSAKTLSVEALSKTGTTQSYALTEPKVYGGKTDTRNFIDDTTYAAWNALDVSQAEKRDPERDEFAYTVTVRAESGFDTDPPYTIRVMRDDPDQFDDLTGITLEDQNGVNITETTQGFAFTPEGLDYKFSVPYLIQSLKITPVPRSQLASVTVNGTKMTEQKGYLVVSLDTGKTNVVTIVVTAESGTTRTYTLNITRSKPSTESRLAKLTVDGQTLKPAFVPGKTGYTVKLPKEITSFTITPTAVDPYATITVDGKPVLSGVASAPITPLEVTTKVNVVVTAQNGTTKKTYVITVTADAYIPKNSNADLRSLKITPADISPKFKPGDIAYEVYVKDDTYSISFVPVTSDSHATVEVMNGTRKLRDNDGNFSSSLVEDESEFEIVVTASDGTTKTYDFIVYRNNEEKQGAMQPITAETIDFAQESPIIIDIHKYAVISADVFNTLRTEYPDKTIIFEGNDYTLELNGKDLKRLVPNTELFDLAISFSSPDEEDILSLMSEFTQNQDLEPVMIYFRHHGELPGPMKLTLSLGREYRNSRMTWNYYNDERDRIDFYGNISTNTRGSFAVKLTHMSTYLVTDTRIAGSEDRSGAGLGEAAMSTTVGNYNIAMTDGKENPNTGGGCG